jgi:hypothetical protein
VNILEEQRLVERQAHPTDRRTVFIKLLEKESALDLFGHDPDSSDHRKLE